jgi:hypothetical protein
VTPPSVETAEAQIAMLTELTKHCEPDAEGRVLVQRDHLIDALEKIRADHRRELQALPTIAGRMISVFGVTV